jgi:long-chain acyl-CoA synthetase
VAQFSENSARWLVVDQAIIACGAVNAVRGSGAPAAELAYIWEHSDSCALVTDSIKLVGALSEQVQRKTTKFVLYIGNDDISGYARLSKVQLYTFKDFEELSKGKKYKRPKVYKGDPLTIVYSSGTTGKPKGVLLSHGNLLSQISAIHPVLKMKAGKSLLSILPIWHMYERTCTYYALAHGCSVNYTNLMNFKKDIGKYAANYLVSVPRVWIAIHSGIINELKNKPVAVQAVFNTLLKVSMSCKKARRVLKNECIYSQNLTLAHKVFPYILANVLAPIDSFAMKFVYKKVKDALGGRFIKGVSGGGALPHHIEDFFEALGVPIYVGYGLTETSPVLSVRKEEDNKIYSVGPALSGGEFKVVDPNSMLEVENGEKGLVLFRGPQVMLGYYKDKEATDKVMLPDGWFITGDLGWLTKDGHLVLTGRQREIVVLLNGENVEAPVLEDICAASPYVDQIVLTGQDMPSLTALVALDMNEVNRALPGRSIEELNWNSDFKALLLNELNLKIKARDSFRPFERISNIYFVPEGFTVANGLMTQTAKVRKTQVLEKYKAEIAGMYKK